MRCGSASGPLGFFVCTVSSFSSSTSAPAQPIQSSALLLEVSSLSLLFPNPCKMLSAVCKETTVDVPYVAELNIKGDTVKMRYVLRSKGGRGEDRETCLGPWTNSLVMSFMRSLGSFT